MTFLINKLRNVLKEESYKRKEKKAFYCWDKKARLNQIPPEGNWHTWLILAGRGFGKTRTGAETIRRWIDQGQSKRIALIGKTIQETRTVMVEGESGLLSIYPFDEQPKFYPSRRQVVWPQGAKATLYGADHFEQLRGPQFDTVWIDEFAKFRYAQALWDQVQLSLRLGANPRCIITTTPRPVPILQNLLHSSDVAVTKGTTFDNEAHLAPGFIHRIIKHYEGTQLGAQELYGEILTDYEGALWKRSLISYEIPPLMKEGRPLLDRIVIAVDPATTHTKESDETGIIVAGRNREEGKGYVIQDLSGRFSPLEWGHRVVQAYHHYQADRVVVETNTGGDLVINVIKSLDSTIAIKKVRATRGKSTRAEPIVALYEQGKIFHMGSFIQLEAQLCEYCPGITTQSPDRLDALVWALTELFLEAENRPSLRIWYINQDHL